MATEAGVIMGDLTKNFSRHEFACKCGCGFDTVDFELLTILQELRDHFGAPVIINSANRCKEDNLRVGGADNSQHLRGRAVDFVVEDVEPHRVQDYLIRQHSGRFGVGYGVTFTHFDTRTVGPARWSY